MDTNEHECFRIGTKNPSSAEGVAKAPLPPGEGLGRGDRMVVGNVSVNYAQVYQYLVSVYFSGMIRPAP